MTFSRFKSTYSIVALLLKPFPFYIHTLFKNDPYMIDWIVKLTVFLRIGLTVTGVTPTAKSGRTCALTVEKHLQEKIFEIR